MEQNPSSPRPPNLTNGTDTPDESQTQTDQTSRPTHNILDVKVGRNAIQFLVTTQDDHTWNSRRVEIVDGGVQCSGVMGNEAIQSLAAAIGNRAESSRSQSNVEPPRSAAFPGPGRTVADNRS